MIKMLDGTNFKINIVTCVFLSTVVHALFIVYGEFHDKISAVKYTDIDYVVVTDAARLVANGGSPFERATYRYTPLLSWILLPGTHLHESWGKVLFCVADVMVGYLIYDIMRWQRVSSLKAIYSASAWFFNPMAIVVSSRGNSESVMACLVLVTLQMILNKNSKYAGLLYGFSIHFKIYPAIYAASFYFALGQRWPKAAKRNALSNYLYQLFWPSNLRITFVLFSVIGFVVPTGICYLFYGDRYLEEAFFYHLRRRDIKHNFSPYFYLLYLMTDQPAVWLSLVSFLPQCLIIVIFSLKLYRPTYLPLCLFLQTYAFVAFNKVCTSQYFLWFLSLLPLVIPRLRFKWHKLFLVLILWIASQAVWLYAAYALEFHCVDTFVYMWIAGLIFFISNICVMDFFIRACYREEQLFNS